MVSIQDKSHGAKRGHREVQDFGKWVGGFPGSQRRRPWYPKYGFETRTDGEIRVGLSITWPFFLEDRSFSIENDLLGRRVPDPCGGVGSSGQIFPRCFRSASKSRNASGLLTGDGRPLGLRGRWMTAWEAGAIASGGARRAGRVRTIRAAGRQGGVSGYFCWLIHHWTLRCFAMSLASTSTGLRYLSMSALDG